MEKVLSFIEKYYHTKTGLYIGSILSGCLSILLIKQIGINVDWIIQIIVFIIVLIIYLVVWYRIHLHIPKSLSHLKGIYFCIEVENEKQRSRIYNDFVKEIERKFHEFALNHHFKIFLLNEYQSKRLKSILKDYINNSELLKNHTSIKENKKIRKRISKFDSIQNKINGAYFLW